MIDTHCHLQTEQFDADRDAIIAEAMASGVEGFIVPAIDYASFDPTLDLAGRYSNIWCGLGIHPHSSQEWNTQIRDRIRTEVLSNPKIVAVGEIGLDYYYDFSPKDVQIQAFREQIELAQELDKPIVIHTRDSIDETLAIVQEMYSGRSKKSGFGQFHCFSGTPEQAERVVSLGFAVSFTGNITFKNSTLAPVVQATPLESMLIETDSPYLAPAPNRGKRNNPAYVGLVAKKIAELTNRDSTDIMRITTENAKRIFQLTAAALLLVAAFFSTDLKAQPGSKPPDSVMTQSRREAEELIRKQREELAREQDKRRQDSIATALQEERERQQEIRDQIRKDSIRAVARAQDEEKARLRAQTPIAWKAIGIGGGLGVGNLSELNQVNRRELVPTSVLATSFQIGTQISRVIDFEISYNSFTVSDNLIPDHLYRPNDSSRPVFYDELKASPPVPFFRPTHEEINTKYLSFDFRFIINPRSPVKFYAGFGYTAVTITNQQDYHLVTDSSDKTTSVTASVKSSFSRGGIKALFGGRYDLEIGDNFILTPFAQISAAFLFNGDAERPIFDFQTASDLITFTHLNVGATLYFGWFGVKRYQ